MNDVGQWVNLLRTPQPRSAAKSRLLDGEEAAQRHVKVLENTPQGKVGVKKSKRSEVQVLRSQVASLVKEKRDLGLSVGIWTVYVYLIFSLSERVLSFVKVQPILLSRRAFVFCVARLLRENNY